MPDTEYNLADEMRRAADAIERFNRRIPNERSGPPLYSDDYYWRPSELRREAEHVDAEEREKAELAEQVEELAQAIFNGSYSRLKWPDHADHAALLRRYAKSAIDAGWHR
jgi:hypothetical protein